VQSNCYLEFGSFVKIKQVSLTQVIGWRCGHVRFFLWKCGHVRKHSSSGPLQLKFGCTFFSW